MALIEKYAFRACKIVPLQHAVNVTGPCHACNKEISVACSPADLEKWRNGGYVQDCFPYLGPAEREFLISGICSKCWDEMFPPEDEDDGDYGDGEGHSDV